MWWSAAVRLMEVRRAVLFASQPTIESLSQQINALKDANTLLDTSLNTFLNTMTAVLALLGVLAAVSVFMFGQTLKEIRQSVKTSVRQEVSRLVGDTVDQYVKESKAELQQTLDRERIVGKIGVDYVLPLSDAGIPNEYRLLEARGFRSIPLHYRSDKAQLSNEVVVLDLVTIPITEEVDIAAQLDAVVNRLSNQSVLVVYVRPGARRSQAVDDLAAKVHYYASANMPITLMGVVVDAAAVAHGLRQ